MPASTGLFDLLAPYFMVGVHLPDAVHNVLSFLHVDELHTAWDESGACLWGVARFDSDRRPSHTTQQGTVWDWHDLTVQFRLTTGRSGSTTVQSGLNVVGGDLKALADAFGHEPGSGSGPSDFPGSRFRLEILLTAVTVHLPFLRGAKLDPVTGLLSADATHQDVKIVLPKILIAVAQGDSIGDSLTFTLESWGAEGLDDPTDWLVGDLIEMDPPYALAGTGNVFGFGFRKAIIDLSDDHTPPEILSQYGAGDDWQGLYLPEVRIFVAPSGLRGLAVDASAKNLLIGLHDTPGVSGDFEVDVINQGGSLDVEVRLYDANGRQFDSVDSNGENPVTHLHSAKAELPAGTSSVSVVVDVQNAQAPYQVTIDGTDVSTTGQHQTVALPHATPVHIQAKDSTSPTPQVYDLDLTLQVRGASAGAVPPSTAIPNPVEFTPPGIDPENHNIQQVTETADNVTLSFSPTSPAPTITTSDGQTPTVNNGQAVIALVHDNMSAVTVTAVWPGGAGATETVRCYFVYDHPNEAEDPDVNGGNPAFVGDPSKTGSAPAAGPSPTVDGQFTGDGAPFATFLGKVPDGSTVTLRGYASYEYQLHDRRDAYNRPLSGRRARVLGDIVENRLANLSPAKSAVLSFSPTPEGARSNDDAWNAYNADASSYGRGETYWRAEFDYTVPASTDVTLTATLQRQARTSDGTPEPKDVPSGHGPTPSWFHRISLLVRIFRNTFVALEVKGEVDFKTAAKQGLTTAAVTAGHAAPGSGDLAGTNLSGNTNPGDGVVDFDLVLSHDDSIGQWREQLIVGAGAADRDGLWRIGSTPAAGDTPSPDFWRDVLGMFAVLAPLINDAVPTSSNDGNVVELAVDLALPFALAALDWVHAESWTWYGVELIAEERAHGGDASVLLDYETDLWLDVRIGGTSLVHCKPDKPVKVRYRAVGFRINWGDDSSRPAYQPMFDASKGYSIEVTDPGTFKVPDPLGNIIQVLGARIARTNPLTVELDMGLKIDLGIISVDRVRVRMPVDPVGPPTITALGVGVDIPNALKGRGYLSLGAQIMGQIDLTIVPVKVRVAAGVAIGHVQDGGRDATSVLVTLAVEFPTPILLAGSGLGIYGFLGLFAMHYHRIENASALVPALEWFQRTGGDPTQISDTTWGPLIDHWAFGVDAVLGTVEGGYVLNLKGMIVLEIPGPRLLIFMKASLISVKPPTKGTQSGTLLAVLDLDFGRGTLTIGISVQYEIRSLLVLKIPVTAFFDFNNGSNFYIDVGSIAAPITLTVLDIFTATGYLEIHGNGIPDFPLGALSGFSIATGLHVALVWGDTGIGLYLKVAAGFDAGVGFSPLLILGQMTLDGELHLFIIGIEAHGRLDVQSDGNITGIQGSVCGEVDFFLFSVSGCVSFSLGGTPPSPPAPPMVRAMSLQSRSPASVLGTGVDRPIDGALCNATDDGSVPQDDHGNSILVPVDSIPVLHLEGAPTLDAGFTGIGDPLGPAPMLAADGFFTRGQVSYAYNLKAISISPAVTGTAIPSVWRSPRALPDGDDSALDLALLDWTPNATPKAVQRSAFLTEQVTGRWGGLCDPVVPAASVFWTFQNSALGPSARGWTLQGVAWPDPAGTKRSQPPPLTLHVTEPWRSRNGFLDSLLNIEPAKVIGANVPCAGAALSTRVAAPVAAQRAPAPRFAGPAPAIALPSASLARLAPQTFFDPDALVRALPADRPLSALPHRAPVAPLAQPPLSFLPGGESGGHVCPSRVLEAPFTHGALLPPAGDEDPGLQSLVKQVQGRRRPGKGFKADLVDAVLFDAGPLVSVRILVLLPTELLRLQALVLRPLNAAGGSLGDRVVTGAVITSPAQIPARWKDAAGPWYHDALLSLQFFAEALLSRTMTLLLVDQTLPAGTTLVELGLRAAAAVKDPRLVPPSFLVGAIEALTVAEAGRAGQDEATRQSDIDTIDGLIGSDPADRALLAPDTLYTVTLQYQWRSRDSSGNVSAWTDAGPQQLSFKTDNKAPQKLDPWVLATNPSPDEGFHFYGDPINVVFSTDDVVGLFAKYGLTLQAVARAASFRPSTPSTISSLETLPGVVLDPWEDTLHGVLDGSTCTTPFQVTRHGRASLAMPLDKLTSYVLDIVNPELTPDTTTVQVPLFRRAFTTSRYGSAADLAQDVLGADWKSTRIAAGLSASLRALGSAPADVEIEQALRAAGLPALEAATQPRVRLIWEDGSPPQPVAVLIDTPEPVWRRRLEPQQVAGTSGDPADYFWALQPATWLGLVEAADASPAVVDRFVASPGGSRTLVILGNSARGRTVHLQLRKYLNSLLDVESTFAPVDFCILQTNGAPWEDLP